MEKEPVKSTRSSRDSHQPLEGTRGDSKKLDAAMCTARPAAIASTAVAPATQISKPVPRPRRRRLPPEERAARRRKQHRELVARGRARVRDAVARLREEEEALQRKLTQLIAGYVARTTHSREESLRARFIDMIIEQASLEAHNECLEDQIDYSVRFQDLVGSKMRVPTKKPESLGQFLADQSFSEDTTQSGDEQHILARERNFRQQLGVAFWSVSASTDDNPDDRVKGKSSVV